MRAAIIFDCLYPWTTGGAERVYRRMAELLVERGYEVDYITRLQWDPSEPPSTTFNVVPVWEGDLYKGHGVRSNAGAARFAFAVRRWLRPRRRDYSLVISSATPVTTLLAARVALGRQARVLVADWWEVWSWRKWRSYAGAVTGTVAAVLQWVASRAVSVCTAGSRFTEARLRAIAPKNDITVLGVMDLLDDPADIVREADAPPYIAFFGRHIPDKRAVTIPAALLRAREHRPDLRAVIAGDGPEREAIAAEIARLGLDDVCEMPGFIERSSMLSLLAGATALINPSAREGFGLVIAEAAACGVPSIVVAGPDNAAAELIVQGVNGFVAPSAEPDDLAAAILAAADGAAQLRSSTRAWYDRAARDSRLGDTIDSVIAGVARRLSR